MNDTAQTLVRTVLKVGAGWLAAKGFASEATTEIVIAGVMAGLGIVWGVMHRSPGPTATK
jgi:hypothetical protein